MEDREQSQHTSYDEEREELEEDRQQGKGLLWSRIIAVSKTPMD
jgi:hypothetical protein